MTRSRARLPKSSGYELTKASSWRDRAACGKPGVNPEWFFPDNRPGRSGACYERKAKEVCVICTVRTPCLAEALANGDEWAVLGGLTPDERTRLTRPRRRRAVSA
jgi:WhiB family redox-sensing transcriptional regulator